MKRFTLVFYILFAILILGCSDSNDNSDDAIDTNVEGPAAVVTFSSGDKCHLYDWQFIYNHEYHERGQAEDGTQWMRTDTVNTKKYDTTLRLNRSDIGEAEFSAENLPGITYTLVSSDKALEANIRTHDGDSLVIEVQNSVVLPQDFGYFWPDRSRQEISAASIVITVERIEGDTDLGCSWLQIDKSYRNIGKQIKQIQFIN
ncbi:MAG: hypothetical protein GWO07_07255 [Candidatus Dadabacteria bacterium]|nr:hypothetical protein [Candidatus Dadabacteria bacterium]NIS08546.1 hypothetical protein [Candidatus Dadabacteria bacterium]NIV41374.1 hypothetical protein [Candidatus Dadabacteria bacterium]NIX14581.1 hypothetical protein [Candidatus Dadabacteria bacterium]NIY21036.1 hypothetical protein [Candidatus Dadabacteria bacterium]